MFEIYSTLGSKSFQQLKAKHILVLYFHCLLFLELTRMIPIRRKKQRGIHVYSFK